jgi:hypothetical protein
MPNAARPVQRGVVTQVSQDEQGLPARVEAPPSGSAASGGADAVDEVVQGSGGQRDAGGVAHPHRSQGLHARRDQHDHDDNSMISSAPAWRVLHRRKPSTSCLDEIAARTAMDAHARPVRSTDPSRTHANSAEGPSPRASPEPGAAYPPTAADSDQDIEGVLGPRPAPCDLRRDGAHVDPTGRTRLRCHACTPASSRCA